MTESAEAERVLALLGDEYVRTILTTADGEAKSVAELSEACDTARSTVYRRVDDLVEAGLLVEQTVIDADGSHLSVYEARMDELSIQLEGGRLVATLEPRRDAATRFTHLWEDIRST